MKESIKPFPQSNLVSNLGTFIKDKELHSQAQMLFTQETDQSNNQACLHIKLECEK